MRKTIKIIPCLCLFFILIMSLIKLSFAQSISSAREKVKNENYIGAEKELKQILESDSENIEIRKLLDEIEQIKNKKKSHDLTERALLEINKKKFGNALKILEEAITIDPSNSEARDLYTSIYEVSKVEEEAVKKEKEAEKEKKEAIAQQMEKDKEDIIFTGPSKLFFKISSIYSLAFSNNLDFINSDISMAGARLEGIYYLDSTQKMLGFSVDYTGYFYKLMGDDDINFLVHRLNSSIRLRTFLLEDDHNSLIVGARLNYHYFYLQNLEDKGVYDFTKLYAPSLGIFISDPVINRFYKNMFFRNIGFEGEINYLNMPIEDNSPSVLEFYISSYYNLNRFRLGLGYRLYMITRGRTKESYNDIEINVGCNY